jgi:ferric-dicitrate binding protein FerR (iron transport regulator)
MVWRGRERDPRTDPAASDVMAAYQAATKAGLPTPECYQAGVEAWRRAHPDHAAAFAAKQAVAVILAAKQKFLLRVG